jgi:hypothetical protein
MVQKRLIVTIYAAVAICTWLLIQHSESLAGWFFALLIVVAGVSLDYFITQRKDRLRH